MKVDHILNLWKRDEYQLDLAWKKLVDGNTWMLYTARVNHEDGSGYDRQELATRIGADGKGG